MTTTAVYCRSCGKPLTEDEKAAKPGRIACSTCMPAPAAPPPQPAAVYGPPPVTLAQPLKPGVSPGLAFLLGLIPGVGAIYNGQYAKGIIHALVFGLLISINQSGLGELEPLGALATVAWYIYMPFEAYHTARKRLLGIQVEEFSSLVELRPAPGAFPVGPVLVITVGVLFLLNNLGLLRIAQLFKFWPVVLIGLGVYMLYCRLGSAKPVNPEPEVSHEQR